MPSFDDRSLKVDQGCQQVCDGADSVVHTYSSKACKTNKRRMGKFSEPMDPCFVGRNAATLQYIGADSVVHTGSLKACETNERRMGKFSEPMDSCFIGRNAATLQYLKFASVDESTKKKMSNAATPKTG